MKVIILKHPITHEEKELKEIRLDMDNMTGEDLAQAEREYLALGGQPTAHSLSLVFCQHLAARASGMSVDTIRALKISDSQRVISEVQAFLFDVDVPTTASGRASDQPA